VTDADNGKPLQGAQACAKRTKGEAGACAITDVAGDYEIDNLAIATDYRVLFSAGPDYLPQYFDFAGSFEEATNIDITGGDQSFIDGALEEVGPGTISGRVSARRTGSALAEIRVCALAAAQYEVLGCAMSAADGTYTLSLPFGSYKVAFNEPQLEHFDPLYLSQFWNEVATFASATTITLGGPESRTGIDARLQTPGEGSEGVATAPSPPASASPPAAVLPPTKPAPLTCRKGFRKEKVKGKLRCVRRKHHHKKHSHRT
jgi:hypothetical protein